MNNQESRELPLKKVGKEVLFLQTDDVIVRTGEGAFLRLKDGSLIHAYTEYCGGNIGDHGEANIAAIFSHDEGETWGEHRLLLRKDEDALNIMSVSFLRLRSGEILLFYLKKTLLNGEVLCLPMVRSSFDECQTWGEERFCGVDTETYHVVNNSRVIQLQSGRIIIPAAVRDGLCKGTHGTAVRYIVSDDEGKTWNTLETIHRMPFENIHGFEEPGLYQHTDGSLWGYYRTDIGCQFETTSLDGGQTWSVPKPNIFFTGARSPMLVRKVCGKYTVAVFNPISLYTGRNLGGIRGRAPYLLAVSEDDGASHNAVSFSKLFFLEDDFDNDYSYPAIIDGDGYFLVAYYHSNGRKRPLNCLKMVKVLADELN